ncbi:dihydrofolate reductase family protein [Actinoplanes utahensis]|uniref:Deaminase/reductase n=1 Tax=Actinoplanes utahensis TaxID=1869 RepID=A0A0A6UAB2_ACTUT|nr:dihydrofolate reductase family protein [Actinoplanes utahensis]KHD71993.1 deaminase/reductase [Actinoplanes utahensis]GIF31672.1 deaminase [Actinoplanes utahensis]
MRKLVYFVASTIDGFIAAPDGSWDFLVLEDDIPAYMREHYPETLPTLGRAAMGVDEPNKVFDTVLMGRGTYEPALQAGITSPYAHLHQIVFSRSLPASTDPEVRFVAEEPLPFVEKLKQQPGRDIWLAGGGDLAGQLLPAVDELIVKLNPTVAGSGIPLAATGFRPHRFALTAATPLPSGVVVLHYRTRTP